MENNEKTYNEIITDSLKKYENNCPNVYDDRECMGEDFRSSSELLHDGFKSKQFDMDEFIGEYLAENEDFRKKIKQILLDY